jgi:hypothetical protein
MPILTIKREELYKYGNLALDSSNCSSYYMRFRTMLSDDEKKVICDTVFYLINWFTELINAFSPTIHQQEEEINQKLIDRLGIIFELEQMLKNLLPFTRNYIPPIAVFGIVDKSSEQLPYANTLFKAGGGAGKKAKKKAGTKRKTKTG